MMYPKHFITVLLSIIFIVAGCVAPSPGVTPGVSQPAATGPELEFVCEPPAFEQPPGKTIIEHKGFLDPPEFYANNQLILMGAPAAIEAVLGVLNQIHADLDLNLGQATLAPPFDMADLLEAYGITNNILPIQRLFSVGLEFENDLNEQVLSPPFRELFAANGFTLSEDIVIEPGPDESAWLIRDEEQGKIYTATREEEPTTQEESIGIYDLVLPNDFQIQLHVLDLPDEVTVAELIVPGYFTLDNNPLLRVYLDYNYTIGRFPQSCPDQLGTSGDGHGVAAHPAGASGGTIPPAAVADFNQQWALQTLTGIGAIDATSSRLTGLQGGATRIAIFDTSPFTDPGPKVINGVQVTDDDNEMELCVAHLEPLTPILDVVDPNFPDISDHGLFVAGLAYAVAPDAELDLIRVLNHQGHGVIFDLVYALAEYMRQHDSLRAQTIFNLSLGISPPTTDFIAAHLDKINAKVSAVTGGTLAEQGFTSLEPSQMGAVLETMLWIANKGGTTIIAAAGNNACADKFPSVAGLSQQPAHYQFVVDVAASGPDQGLACYSYMGRTIAPGGNPAPVAPTCAADHATGSLCNVERIQCCTGPDCGHGLISVVLAEPTPGSETYEFAYWVGTSFATPLVSGLAALGLEDNGSGSVVEQKLQNCDRDGDPNTTGFATVECALQP